MSVKFNVERMRRLLTVRIYLIWIAQMDKDTPYHTGLFDLMAERACEAADALVGKMKERDTENSGSDD